MKLTNYLQGIKHLTDMESIIKTQQDLGMNLSQGQIQYLAYFKGKTQKKAGYYLKAKDILESLIKEEISSKLKLKSLIKLAKIYTNLAYTVRARELLKEAKAILTAEFSDNRYLRLQYRIAKTKYFLELRVMGHFKRSVKKLFERELNP